MEELFERLKNETKKALARKSHPPRKKKVPTPEERSKKFLSKVPASLLRAAKSGQGEYLILHLGHKSSMDTFEQLVFDGCKKLGLPVSVEECFSLPPGDRESMGYFIHLKWAEKK